MEGRQQKTREVRGHFQHCWRVTAPSLTSLAAWNRGAATPARQESLLTHSPAGNCLPKIPFSPVTSHSSLLLLLGQEERTDDTKPHFLKHHEPPAQDQIKVQGARAVWSFPRTLFILQKRTLQPSITGWQLPGCVRAAELGPQPAPGEGHSAWHHPQPHGEPWHSSPCLDLALQSTCEERKRRSPG